MPPPSPDLRVVSIRELEPPPELGEAGKAAWVALSAELSARGTLTYSVRVLLERYCRTLDRLDAAERSLDRHGATFETSTGYRQQSPEVSIINKATAELRALAADLVLTPKSAASVRVKASGNAKDRLREIRSTLGKPTPPAA